MKTKIDGNGQTYFEVENIRITVKDQTWDDCPGLSIRAYQPNGSLHWGAEIPIRNKETAFDFLMGIYKAFEALRLDH